MAEIQDLVVVDDNNTGRWPENMEFSDVNDAGRADEGLLSRWYKDTDGSITASGSSNAFTITSNRTISSLFNNLRMAFTANHSITGATTLNLNGLGAKSVKRYNGQALASGDIISGQPILVIYKSSGDQWFMVSAPAALTGNTFVDLSENASPGTPAADVARLHARDDGSGTTRMYWIDSAASVRVLLDAATQAGMEAHTSAVSGVTPSVQHFHPGHPKAGGKLNGSGTPAFASGDYGMGAVTDNGTGSYTLAFDTAFADTNYWCAAWARFTSATPRGLCTALSTDTKTVSAFQISTCDAANATLTDLTEIGITFWGDYA